MEIYKDLKIDQAHLSKLKHLLNNSNDDENTIWKKYEAISSQASEKILTTQKQEDQYQICETYYYILYEKYANNRYKEHQSHIIKPYKYSKNFRFVLPSDIDFLKS